MIGFRARTRPTHPSHTRPPFHHTGSRRGIDPNGRIDRSLTRTTHSTRHGPRNTIPLHVPPCHATWPGSIGHLEHRGWRRPTQRRVHHLIHASAHARRTMNRPRSARSPVSPHPPPGGSGKPGICPVRTPPTTLIRGGHQPITGPMVTHHERSSPRAAMCMYGMTIRTGVPLLHRWRRLKSIGIPSRPARGIRPFDELRNQPKPAARAPNTVCPGAPTNRPVPNQPLCARVP